MGYGDEIRRLREARGWSRQEQLAEAAGVNKETVVRAENSGNVSVFKLQLIAAALNVELGAFFSGPTMPDADARLWQSMTDEQRDFVRKAILGLLGRSP